ncbi:MAG: hypothetical protein KDC42_08160 [Ignavibacteriae bacterium]|nr:hypothetical protein [Ignavibacteriota bacterium]
MIKNSKIFDILRTFSREEFKDFRKFLNSPYFISREKLSELYDLLLKHARHKDFRSVDASFLYMKLFPGEFRERGYSDSTMRFFLNALYHAAEDFLAVRAFRKKDMLRCELLREELLSKGLYGPFSINLASAEKHLNESNISDPAFYLLRYNLEQEKLNISNVMSGQKIRKGKKQDTSEHKLAAKYLFNYFTIELTGLADIYVKYCKQKNVHIDERFLEYMYHSINIEKLIEFLNTVSDKGDKKKVDIAEIYFAKYKAFTFMDNDKYYEDYKRMLISRARDIEIDYRHHFFARLLDYCVLKRRSKPSVKKYARELISVYKLVIENGLYRHSKNKNFPMDLFRNVIIAGLREGEIKWIEEFIDRFGPKLHKDLRKDAIHYAKARLMFEKRDFYGTISNLAKMKNEYHQFTVEKKAFYLMSLYELAKYEEALKFIDAFRHYLDNTDYISSRIKKINKRLVYFVGKLIREHGKVNSISDGYIRREIFKEEDVYSKDWLLKKADELIRRKPNQSKSTRKLRPHKTTRFSI